MSVPVEHGCGGGMAEVPSMDTQKRSNSNNDIGLNLKATELRLGLPGSESPERERDGTSVTVEDKNNKNNGFSMLKSMSMVCGAKRGFSDAIDGVSGSGKWVLSGSGGSEVGLGKNGVLFSPSPRGVTAAECTNNQQTPLPAASLVVKETVPHAPKPLHDKKPQTSSAPAAKAQVVGWPPIRTFRKNSMATQPQKDDGDAEAKSSGCLYVKVSMEGAPYLRKVDLNSFSTYKELSSALEKMFSCFTISQCGSYGVSSRENLSESRLMDLLHGSEYVLTYEDKDGDWMLVGDVPWEMFTNSCNRLRIMKSSEAIGLAPRAMEKCKSRN